MKKTNTPLEMFDRQLREDYPDHPGCLAARTALKFIQGQQAAATLKDFIATTKQELTVTVMQAMYHEGLRIRPRSAANPHGEDTINHKLTYLDNLQGQIPGLHIRMLVVDDGCDGKGIAEEISGVVAKTLIASWRQTHAQSAIETKVVYLADAIASQSKLIPADLTTTTQSIKGGSVLYGLAFATTDWKPRQTGRHMILDSDTDLSVNIEQLPTLIMAMLEHNCAVVAASRLEPESVQKIDEGRQGPGELFAETWRAMLPTLASKISDTNRGFKLIDADFVPQLLEGIHEYGFPYQIELLLLAAKAGRVMSVPTTYLDSDALSTQGDIPIQPYFNQVKGVLDIATRHGEESHDELKSIIQKLADMGDAGANWWDAISYKYATVSEVVNEFNTHHG